MLGRCDVIVTGCNLDKASLAEMPRFLPWPVLVCTQADTGELHELHELQEEAREAGSAPHGKANPSRCYVAKKQASRASMAMARL